MPSLIDQIKVVAARVIRQSAIEIQSLAEKIPPALAKKYGELEKSIEARLMAAAQRKPTLAKARASRERPLTARGTSLARKPRKPKAKPVKRRAKSAVKSKKKKAK